MAKYLIIGFEYCEKLYKAIAHCKTSRICKEYRITVMNGDLEKLLYGNHTIQEINSTLQVELSDNNVQDVLKVSIASALGKLLGLPVIKK
ncbi:MAG: hypothetical protein ACXWV2_07830 [Chitinophagaceae bacterium]